MRLIELEEMYFKVEVQCKNTEENYRHGLKVFNQWIKENFNIELIEEVKNMHIKQYNSYLKSLVGKFKGSTLRGRLACVLSFLNFAITNDFLESSVTKGVKIYFENDSEESGFLTIEETKQLLNSVLESSPVGKRNFLELRSRDYAIILMGATYGLRNSEMCNLTFDMIEGDSLTIPKELRKNKTKLTVVLTEEVRNALEDYYKYRTSDTDFIFVSTKGKQMTRKSMNEMVKKRIVESGLDGIPNLHFHSLRHTANVRMSRTMGATERMLVLGQKTIEANNKYNHLTNDVFNKIGIFQ